MEAEPSAFGGLPIILAGLVILAVVLMGDRAAKKRKSHAAGSGGDGSVYAGSDGDAGGDCGGDGGGGD